MRFFRFLYNIPLVGFLLKKVMNKMGTVTFPGSAEYWEKRYSTGGSSGPGSYNRLAEYKAEIINGFVKTHQIEKVLEFGCGDGNQLAYANYNSYIGLDVSPKAIDLCWSKFKSDQNKSFFLYNTKTFHDNHGIFKAELVLSLDVIFHLIEDEIFELYMKHLFQSSSRFVIIYSSNFDGERSIHYMDRNFSKWIDRNMSNWKLFKFIENKYKYDSADTENTSRSHFYIYQKVDN